MACAHGPSYSDSEVERIISAWEPETVSEYKIKTRLLLIDVRGTYVASHLRRIIFCYSTRWSVSRGSQRSSRGHGMCGGPGLNSGNDKGGLKVSKEGQGRASCDREWVSLQQR